MPSYRRIAPADASLRALDSRAVNISRLPGDRGTLASHIIATARAQQAAQDAARHAVHASNGRISVTTNYRIPLQDMLTAHR